MEHRLDVDGLELLPGLIAARELRALEALLPSEKVGAGIRVFDNPELSRWIDDGNLGCAVRKRLGDKARPVRAILFDKTANANWAVGWHQDRTIAVRQSIATPGFDHWTKKSGVDHAEPQFSVMENMVTARVHLDPVDASNAPLLVAPGSHRLGRVEERGIMAAVARCGTYACLASEGDVWLYRTSIIHASEKSKNVKSRRVLQIDFSPDDLPEPLEWLGIADA